MIDVGVGLWNMRSTAAQAGEHAGRVQRAATGRPAAEALGFHSLWLAEHHFWYDGWCPAPLTAAAAVLGATSPGWAPELAIHMLSLWDLDVAGSAAGTLTRCRAAASSSGWVSVTATRSTTASGSPAGPAGV